MSAASESHSESTNPPSESKAESEAEFDDFVDANETNAKFSTMSRPELLEFIRGETKLPELKKDTENAKELLAQYMRESKELLARTPRIWAVKPVEHLQMLKERISLHKDEI